MTYIANRPVRFDRNYAIGEKIPDGVIDPKMTAKLIGMGRIIRIYDDAPEAGKPAAEFRCAECGKTFPSKAALASHSRVHKK